MEESVQQLLTVIKDALTKFKAADYDGVQDVLRSKPYREAMRGLTDVKDLETLQKQTSSALSHSLEQRSFPLISKEAFINMLHDVATVFDSDLYQEVEKNIKLKEEIANIYSHLDTLCNDQISGRMNEKTITGIKQFMDRLLKKIEDPDALPLLSFNSLISALDGNLHRVVEHISAVRIEQAQALTHHEQQLFNELGWQAYWKELVSRRWLGDHHAGEMVSPTTTTKQVQLEGKALQEFGNVTILDTPLKKMGAGISCVAGTALVAHGIYNVYQAFVPPPEEPIELPELFGADTIPRDGVNWLRMLVGVSEVGLGAATLHRQLTGRWGTGAITGHAEALCTHAAPVQGRG